MVVDEFARRLGYDVFPVLLHKDMTARDLLQQRGTLPNGDTVWKSTPLVTAAMEGGVAVLDGVNRVDVSTVTVLQRLAHDREITLNDGTLLVSGDRFGSCILAPWNLCAALHFLALFLASHVCACGLQPTLPLCLFLGGSYCHA